ncbi:F0F1 ATP synthase subunit beta [Candidatus Saccharibacteria bacterium]|nr:F0F1 ATP synthase subunit beta [Candidatus Saccharibacteria bacterium]
MSSGQLKAEVQSVNGLVVKAEFAGRPPILGQLLHLFEKPDLQFLVIGVQDSDVLVALNLTETSLEQGDKLLSNGEILKLPVGQGAMGRVFDALGRTLDSDDPLKQISYVPVADDTEINLDAASADTVIETGIKVIDFFAPFVRGRKVGILGGAGVGKTVLTTELMHNVTRAGKDLSFFVGMGERIREAFELYQTLKEANLLKNTVMYLGQMNENAAMRFLTARSAATVARYFRDANKTDVLFFVDNIYRYLQAGNELSTQLDAASSEGGYQPTLFSELSRFEQNLSISKNGSITAVQSIFVPADDLSDPAVVAMYQQLDSVIVLSRQVAERGIYPAVDLLNTTSAVLTAEIVGQQHASLVPLVQKILQKHKSLEGIVAIIGEAELSLVDQNYYHRAQELIQYFAQNMFVTEKLSGIKGQYVPRAQMLKEVDKIVNGG